jgi:hypothetical protein
MPMIMTIKVKAIIIMIIINYRNIRKTSGKHSSAKLKKAASLRTASILGRTVTQYLTVLQIHY